MAQANENQDFNYYMMNMPKWFLDLPTEEKVKIAQQFIKYSESNEVLDTEEKLIKELLP
jgi:hypothetical protein